jgi:hypothetical protein
MPFSASFLFRLRRLARGQGARVFACVIAFALIANAIVVAALPVVSAGQGHAVAATVDQPPCAHHDPAKPAQTAHRHQHADDCLCCVGKLCACGPLCAAVSFIALPAGMSPAQAAIEPASLPRAYVTLAAPLLRPPIA